MTLLIDGSHWRVSEFDTAVIDYAVRHYGFSLDDAEDAGIFEEARRDSNRLVSELTSEQCEALTWMADEAVNHMCMTETVYVEESCLWLGTECRVYDPETGDKVGCCCEHEGCCGE